MSQINMPDKDKLSFLAEVESSVEHAPPLGLPFSKMKGKGKGKDAGDDASANANAKPKKKGLVSTGGVDVQTMGSQVIYVARAETRAKQTDKAKMCAGVSAFRSATRLPSSGPLAFGAKVEERIKLGRQLRLNVTGGTIAGKAPDGKTNQYVEENRENARTHARTHARFLPLHSLTRIITCPSFLFLSLPFSFLSFPFLSFPFSFRYIKGANVQFMVKGNKKKGEPTKLQAIGTCMRWKGETALGGDLQVIQMIGEDSALNCRANLNNRGAGSIQVRITSTDTIKWAGVAIVPILTTLWGLVTGGDL